MIRTTDHLLSVDQAQSLIDEHVHVLPAQRVDVAACNGRVLREQIVAERDQPPFDRSTMDGIAMSSVDTANTLRVSAVAAAGAAPVHYDGAGSCVEIMTGAVVPAGCDVVVPVERLSREADQVVIDTEATRAPGTFIHARGSDHAQGQPLLSAGEKIAATHMAVLVSAGCATPLVSRSPRIAVLATGDELVDVDQPVAAHQIRRSNDYALEALLHQHGFNDVSRHHVADERSAVAAALTRALSRGDVVVISGGVSRGRYDFVADELAGAGVRKVFHRIAQRPGKPMWFGTGPNHQLVFALPGNPVSALVCLRRYVIPALRRQSGVNVTASPERVRLKAAVRFAPALTWFAAATLETDGAARAATLHPVNTSGDFTALAGTHGLVEFPATASDFGAGSVLPWHPW